MVYIIQEEDELAHFGVKGMKWGVRKERPSGADPTAEAKSAHRKEVAKKVAIGTGILVVAAGAAYATYAMSKHGSLPIDSLSKSATTTGKSAIDKVLSDPTDIIHSSRGRELGYRFVKQGGLKDALHEYESAGFTGSEGGDVFRRYGAHAEKIAARFTDPEGRKDQSGRPILHEVIVPSSMTDGINSLEDIRQKIWPLLKTEYDAVYNTKVIR